MLRDEDALAAGKLTFEGTLNIGWGSENLPVVLRLQYPDGFPYARPEVIPLENATPQEGQQRRPRFFSARHQMANGSICLFERDPDEDPRAYVRGVQALRRAQIWLPHAIRGRLPRKLDTLESELEAHYNRRGDVLLGPMMFEDLGHHGGKLVLNSLGAPLRDEQYPLHVVSHVASSAGWHNDEKVLGAVFDQNPEFWSASPPKGPGLIEVQWFWIDQEPPPIRSVGELAALLFGQDTDPLTRLRAELTADVATRNALDIPVCFPGREGGKREWLFFRIPLRKSSLPKQHVPGLQEKGQLLDLSASTILDNAEVSILRVHDLRPQSLALRNSGRVPANARTFKLGVVGAGSLGSTCADLLGKATVGSLRIIDPALLNAHNAVRHVAGLVSAGLQKAPVVAAMVHAHNPHCELTCETKDATTLPENDALWQATCVLSTIADDAAELALNRVAVAKGTTVFYLRALRSGSCGRLIRVRPGEDACLECLAHYHADRDTRSIIIPPAPGEVITRECGQPVLASSAADLAVVAGVAVKTLLSDLHDRGASNQWVWTTEGVSEHKTLATPFSRASVSLPPHRKCGICSMDRPTRLRIDDAHRETMTRLAREQAPRETGGILVGRREGDLVEILAISDAGPNAVSERTRFVRDGPYCQKFLEDTAHKMGSGVDYVGEWHSHPGSSAQPSPRDTESFAEIAADPDYLTTAPILIIVAPSEASDEVDWSFSVFPAGGLAQNIDVVPSDRVEG